MVESELTTAEPSPDTETPAHTDASIEGASRRAERRAAAKSRTFFGRNRAWIIAAAVAGVLVCVGVADVALSWDKVHPGVRIGGVSVGSMTPDQARAAIRQSFANASVSPVKIDWEGKTYPVSAQDLGAAIDTTASVEEAMAVGRGDNPFGAAWDRLVATFAGVDIASRVTADATATAAALASLTEAVAEPAADAAVSVSGTTIKVTASKVGRALDRQATLDRVFAGFLAGGGTVEAVVREEQPAVSDAAARAAADQAEVLISAAARVTYDGSSLDIPREAVARCLVFVRGGGEESTAVAAAPVTLSASFDATRLAPAVASLTSGLGRKAKNASFKTDKGSVRIVPSQVGLGPDLQQLAADLMTACSAGGSRSATLVLKETQPKLTTEAAKDMGIKERISTFTTSYSTANPARTNNVHLLAKAFDGKLVAPGTVFSFNGTAGQRTAAKGYQEAPAIVKGKLVPQLGGGVCQVGTTFFNTVFLSGLPIVERHNHSFYISHYPTGRDATVSWGGPDFKFKNDTSSWILIRTSVTASTLTISLYGTDPGYDVDYKTGAFTDFVPHSVEKIKDPKLAAGKKVVEDTGIDGRSIIVRRIVRLGGQVVREDTFVSHYSPKEEVVRVGTKPSTTPTGTP